MFLMEKMRQKSAAEHKRAIASGTSVLNIDIHYFADKEVANPKHRK